MIIIPSNVTTSKVQTTPVAYVALDGDVYEPIVGVNWFKGHFTTVNVSSPAKFGSGSLRLASTSGFFTSTSSNSYLVNGDGTWGFKLRDFTIELWVWLGRNDQSYAGIFDTRNGTSEPTPFIYINGGKLSFAKGNFVTMITGNDTVPTGQWNHIAVSRSGTSTRLFLNGIQQGSTLTDTNNYSSSNGNYFVVGSLSSGGGIGDSTYPAYLDDIFVCIGGKYTENFSVPTVPAYP